MVKKKEVKNEEDKRIRKIEKKKVLAPNRLDARPDVSS